PAVTEMNVNDVGTQIVNRMSYARPGSKVSPRPAPRTQADHLDSVALRSQCGSQPLNDDPPQRKSARGVHTGDKENPQFGGNGCLTPRSHAARSPARRDSLLGGSVDDPCPGLR